MRAKFLSGSTPSWNKIHAAYCSYSDRATVPRLWSGRSVLAGEICSSLPTPHVSMEFKLPFDPHEQHWIAWPGVGAGCWNPAEDFLDFLRCHPQFVSVMFEILHRALMSLGGFTGAEGPKIAALARLWIFLARIQPVFS